MATGFNPADINSVVVNNQPTNPTQSAPGLSVTTNSILLATNEYVVSTGGAKGNDGKNNQLLMQNALQ